MLETVVPKSIGSKVMIVCGEYRGLVGEIIERDSKREQIIVQLEGFTVATCTFDDVAQCN